MVMTIMAIVLLAAGGGGYLWFRTAGSPQPATVQPQKLLPEAAARPDEPFMTTLYLPANGALVPAEVAVKREPDVQLQARQVAAALLAGERGRTAAVLKELKLRALYLDPAGTAYLDLSPVASGQRELRASAGEELLAVYALVNTMTQNFPEVRQVRFVVDGREARTLAGHIDLSRAFVKRTDLVKQQ